MTASRTCKIMHVVGARPNFMKVAPVMAAMTAWNESCEARAPRFEQVLVHTGQHYDDVLSQVFLEQLALPEPDESLRVGSGSHARQTARLLEALEPVMLRHRPDLVLVPGDVNSTCAAALTAAKLVLPVAHLEAGLRSGDRAMPEEINRIVADHVSDVLLTTCAEANANLLREGIPAARITNVGNTMIDSLLHLLERGEAAAAGTRARLGIGAGEFVLVTLHRPSNVDDPPQLERLLRVLHTLGRDVQVVFPMHLRTRARVTELPGWNRDRQRDGNCLILTDPLGYIEFLGLMRHAAAVITDSGGVQEETTALGIPCVTVRTTTERPITVTEGTNRLADPFDHAAILVAARAAVERGRQARAAAAEPPRIPLWDGRAAGRVVEVLARWARARRDGAAGPPR